MEGILAGLTAFNTLSPEILTLISVLRSNDPRTDEEIVAAMRAKVAEIKRITEEDMSANP